MKYILLIPIFIFFSFFTVWPMVEVVKLSLFKTNFITSTFVGFNNYIQSFSNSDFLQSIVNSLFYMAILVPGQVFTALFFAFWLFRINKHWQDVSRIILYLPTLSAGIIIAQSWKFLFHINGPINWLLNEKVNWFGQFYTAIPIISFIVIFSSFGANTIILLASIQNVNKDYLEAATIDGCNYSQIKRKIIIPLIMPTILMIAILSAINSLMIFETVFLLAPQDYAATITYSIYTTSFKLSKYGLSSAQAIILLIITIGLSTIKRKVEK